MTKADLMLAYPLAFEDDHNTIWTSQKAAEAADWTYAHGDGFMDEILGWDWDDAVQNYQVTIEKRRKREFWQRHPALRRVVKFIVARWRFVSLFCGIVWRDWYGRISWSMAWKMAGDVCLR